MTDQRDGGADGREEDTLVAQRRQKLARLRARGEVFRNDFRRDALAGELLERFGGHPADALEAEGVRVQVAGRMMAKRIMGKASFARLQDMSGAIQLFIQRDALGAEVYQDFKNWDVGDLVGAEGILFRTRTGELSVRVRRLLLLTKSLRPLPEKFHGLSNRQIRYRQRYLDLIVNLDSRAVFQTRARIIQALRQLLDQRGFMEVETPMMQPIPGGATARPFTTHHNALDMTLYLRIAPELYLKRLVVGGFERVYEINRNFRNEGVSSRHNPEFTMLEFYQAYAGYEDLMILTESLLRQLTEQVLGRSVLTYQGITLDFGAPFRRLALSEAVLAAHRSLDPASLRDSRVLGQYCRSQGIEIKPSWGWGKMVLELFEKSVEETLSEPTFVYDFPKEVSPLARARDDDPGLTERFELFIAGREIANGFSELNDAEEQAARFRAQAAEKEAGDDEAMFYDADYIRALEYGLPPTAGEGIGIDRLVMLLTDSPSIRDVLLFPHMRPED